MSIFVWNTPTLARLSSYVNIDFFSCRGVSTFGLYPDKYMHMTTSHEIYERALRSIFTRQKIGLLILNICLFVKRVCSQNWSCTLLEKKQWMLGNGKCDLNRKFTMQGNYKYKQITEIKSRNGWLLSWILTGHVQVTISGKGKGHDFGLD